MKILLDKLNSFLNEKGLFQQINADDLNHCKKVEIFGLDNDKLDFCRLFLSWNNEKQPSIKFALTLATTFEENKSEEVMLNGIETLQAMQRIRQLLLEKVKNGEKEISEQELKKVLKID